MPEPETYCSICGEKLAHDLLPQELAEHRVIKCGELSYIELAHRSCAVAEDAQDDTNCSGCGGRLIWEYTKLGGCCDLCGVSGQNEVDEVLCFRHKGKAFEGLQIV